MEYLPQRIETLGAEAARTRADYLKTLLNTVAICADLTETEQGIGDSDRATKALPYFPYTTLFRSLTARSKR